MKYLLSSMLVAALAVAGSFEAAAAPQIRFNTGRSYSYGTPYRHNYGNYDRYDAYRDGFHRRLNRYRNQYGYNNNWRNYNDYDFYDRNYGQYRDYRNYYRNNPYSGYNNNYYYSRPGFSIGDGRAGFYFSF